MTAVLRRPLVLVASVVVALTGSARAASDEGIFVRTEGAIPCATKESFFERVHERAPVARLAGQGEQARTFTISVQGSEPDLRGNLMVVRLDGSTTTRDVAGASCDEVVDALALITALDIDPRSAEPPSLPPPSPPVAPESAAPPAPVPARTWELSAGVGVSLTRGVAPVSLVGIPIEVDLFFPRDDLLSPSFGIGFERTFSRTAAAASGDADFDLTRGFVEACPVSWSWRALRLFPCLRLDAGALRGTGRQGKEIDRPGSETRSWFALDVSGHARLRLAPRLHLDLALGVGTPLQGPYQFQVDPDISLGEVQRYNWRGGLALGVRFL
jgi:hypothetical protein